MFAYFVGSINFSIILTKFSKDKEDIKTKGSGNAGATNAVRAYGWSFGLLVFFLDTSKAYWFAFILGFLQKNNPAFSTTLPQLITLFVIVGHIFPIFFDFKGGKGAATNLGMISSISILLALIGAIIFILMVGITRYVSLGSVVIPYGLAAMSFIPIFNGWYDSMISAGPFWLTPVCLFIASLIVSISHRQNIINLIQRKERKISFSKKTKDSLETNIQTEANQEI